MNHFAGYARWLDMHPHGFVVMETTQRLHGAGCSYIAAIYKTKSASTPKLFFADRSELEQWARRERLRLRSCSE